MELQEVFPKEVLDQVASALPPNVKKNMIIVGSLAAAYWLFENDASIGVRTKDVDCVLSPHVEAIGAGRAIAETLLANGWEPKRGGEFGEPGDAKTEDGLLPAIRLFPPYSKDWFIELLTEPKAAPQEKMNLTRVVIDQVGHFGLPSFPFLKAATYHAAQTEFGIRCALPEMMMLHHLLENPTIKPKTTNETSIKRIHKDLGRVLAIARLSAPDSWESWPPMWENCLREIFPERKMALVETLGNGLKELVENAADLQQAVDTCVSGLLSGRNASADQLQVTGMRLLTFVVDEVKARFRS